MDKYHNKQHVFRRSSRLLSYPLMNMQRKYVRYVIDTAAVYLFVHGENQLMYLVSA